MSGEGNEDNASYKEKGLLWTPGGPWLLVAAEHGLATEISEI